MEDRYHLPVMLRETVEALVVDRDGVYIDGTFGGGGHTAAIVERLGAEGRVIGCDADPVAIERGRERFADEPRVTLRHGYYGDLFATFAREGVSASGILLDLGVSSRQLDSDQIGLSYRQEMPLDMRFDPERAGESAADILARIDAGDLATLLRTYGEEPAAWTIAQAIVKGRERRPITTTTALREIIADVIPERFLIKALSRVFQALRIVVNDELGELERGLGLAPELLREGGRCAVLTYHSLEDRLVKRTFRDEEQGCICPPEYEECRCGKGRGKVRRLKVITRKPMLPAPDEIDENPRARSAKLRVAERVKS